MKNNTLLLIALILAAPAAFAHHIGPAGCGLGNQMFHKDSQVLAATTNGLSWNQAFGITSGTSGCTEESAQAQMLNFIDANKMALQDDAARGQGETLNTLASIMGCQDAAALATTLKTNYSEIFGDGHATSSALTKSIQTTVEKDQHLARTCQHVG